ncbi:TVP38/TMEM64 family protein [Arenicella xantha]|uniref:Putative membrane protein YdjX (TVP38/TMEM64 family) n=1 Tax=Arenicella xantha TaxID=644221 RepID=A0A395JI38_9GAMM|nr:VTT domain-containing protein [Arenicella xantha]RBP48564.1 putative membrane protein YdjX (TVP38/TMEM64 family) [Arenicella xantha]
MKALLKLTLVLVTIFASTFLLAKSTGIISVEKIELWLTTAKNVDALWLASVIILLLFCDLFIAVPTLTIIILSGYFLGHTVGALTSITGVMLAGITGYTLSYFFGERLEKLVVKDHQQRVELREQFKRYGLLMIIFSRAMPILPEVTACLSGLTKMPFMKFLFAWSVSSIPYVIIATYSGSISTLENPKPAITTAIALTVFMWAAWFMIKRLAKRKPA